MPRRKDVFLMAGSIFRKQSLDKVNSPEQLNDYIKASNPSAWLVIVAAIILLVSVLVWGVMGSLDTTVSVNGIARGETVICYTSDASSISTGNKVSVGELEGTVISVSERPLSRAQLEAELDADEYTLYCLELSEWSYIVEISLPGCTEEGFVSASIVTESTKPISFIFD